MLGEGLRERCAALATRHVSRPSARQLVLLLVLRLLPVRWG